MVAGPGWPGPGCRRPVREPVHKKAVAAMAGATVAFIGTWPAMILTGGSLFVIPIAVAFFVLAMVVSTGWLVLLHGWLDKRAGRPRQGCHRALRACPEPDCSYRVEAFPHPPTRYRLAVLVERP